MAEAVIDALEEVDVDDGEFTLDAKRKVLRIGVASSKRIRAQSSCTSKGLLKRFAIGESGQLIGVRILKNAEMDAIDFDQAPNETFPLRGEGRRRFDVDQPNDFRLVCDGKYLMSYTALIGSV